MDTLSRKKIIQMKAKRFLAAFSLAFLTVASSFAQPPVWQPGYPNISNVGSCVTVDYGASGFGTNGYIYIVVANSVISNTTYTSTQVKNWAVAGTTTTSRVVALAIPITSSTPIGQIEAALQTFYNNRNHTMLIVLEHQNGTFHSSNPTALYFQTTVCPQVFLFTGWSPSGQCVNTGVTGGLLLNPMGATGICSETEWVINWGDGPGSVFTHISQHSNDFPPAYMLTYNYPLLSNTCNYHATLTIRNKCGELYTVSNTIVAHGRDSDVDGRISIDALGKHVVDAANKRIIVCPGDTVRLTDNSIWNCQNPFIVATGVYGNPNSSDRGVQWIYGMDATPSSILPGVIGARNNTINGTVTVTGLGTIAYPSGNGLYSNRETITTPIGMPPKASNHNPNPNSAPIIIPLTAEDGQMFRVYLKYWNDCNPGDSEWVDDYVDIVIQAPPAPTVPGKEICFDESRTLTVTSPVAGTIRWYSNATLSSSALLHIGSSYTPTITTAGTYTYWVTDQYLTGLECMSPPSQVTLTVRAALSQPGAISGINAICVGATGLTYSVASSPPAGVRYIWTVPSGWTITAGQNTNTITVNAGSGLGAQNISVRAEYTTAATSGSFCPTTANNFSVTVNPQPVAPAPNVKTPNLATVCVGTNVSLTITPGSGGVGCSDEYQYRINSGAWQPYTSGATISTTTTTTSVEIQGRRTNCTAGTGCNGTAWVSLASWTVVPQPVAPVLAKSPNLATVCAGLNVSASIATPGTGGFGCSDVLQYRTRTGTTWSTWQSYTAGAAISTTGRTGVEIQAQRTNCTTGAGCTASPIVTVAWDVVPQPTPSTLLSRTPDIAAVCIGQGVSALFNPGSGGVGCTDEWRYSINGGSTWTTYVPGNPINTATASIGTGTVIIQARRALSCTAGAGCSSDWVTRTTWNVAAHPTRPVVNVPSHTAGATICLGTNLSATFLAGGGGVGCTDGYQVTIDNGVTWSTYTPGTPINTTSATIGTGTVRIQTRRINCTTGAGCTEAPWATQISWNVIAAPTPVISGTFDLCVPTSGTYSTAWSPTYNYSWSVSGGTISGSTTGSSVTVNWSGVGTGTISVTVTDIGTSCQGTDTRSVTKNPGAPTAQPTITGAASICRNGTLTLTSSAVSTASSYDWNYSWTGATDDITTTTTTNSIDLTGLAPGAYSVRVRGRNGCGPGPYNTHNFVINDIPDLSTLTNTVCSDDPIGITLGITNLNATYCSGITYNITNINFLGLTYSGSGALPTLPANGLSASAISAHSWKNTSSANIDVIYTVVPVSTQGCTGAPKSVVVTIKPTPLLSSPYSIAAICSGGAVNYTATSITTGGVSFSWSRAAVTGITPATGSGSNATISETLTNNTILPITVTYAYTLTANGCTNIEYVTMVVNPTPSITNRIVSICSGGTFTVTPVNGGTDIVPANTTYSWSATTVPSGITGAVGGSGSSITGSPVNNTNGALNVTYTVTPTTTTGGNACPGATFTVIVTVNPTPSIAAKTAVICSGGSFSVTPANGGGDIVPTGTTYSWSAPTAAGIGGLVSGTNAAAITGTLTSTNITATNVTYLVTPTSGTCNGTPFNVVVTVNPTPDITAMSTSICSGGSFSLTPANGTNGRVPGNTTYTWVTTTVPSGITGAAGGSGSAIAGGALTNTTNGALNVVYTVTPTTTTNGNACQGATFTVTVTVNPTPSIAAKTAIICSGGTFTVIPANGGGDIVPTGTTYSWSAPTVAGIGGLVSGTNETTITGTLTSTNIIATNVTYSVTPRSGSCNGTPFNVTVTVNPTAAITAMATSICSGGSFSLTPANGTNGRVPANTTYTWITTTVPPGISGATSGSGSAIAGGALTNATNGALNVVYTVTPTTTTGGNACQGATFTVTVTVNPMPDISAISRTVCSAAPFTVTPVNGTNGIVPTGTTYTWSAPTISGAAGNITGGAGGSGSAITGTLTNTTTSVQTATYSVTPTSGSCTGASFNVTITVNPRAVITSATTGAICTGVPYSYIAVSSTAGVAFTWSRAVVGGISNTAASGSTPNINETLVNTTTYPINVTYEIIASYDGCPGVPFYHVVTVNPTPTLTSSLTPAAVCSNIPFSYTPSSATTGTTFTWTRATVAGITPLGTSGSGAVNETLRNITGAPITVTYTYTLTANGCMNTQNVTVVVNPEPVITTGQNVIACSGLALNYQILLDNFTNPADGVTFMWSAPTLSPASANFTGGTARTTASSANITDTFINTTGGVGTATYTVTPYKDGCAGTPVTVTITIGAQPVLDNLDKTVCSNETIALLLGVAPGSIAASYYNIISVTPQAGLVPASGNVTVPNPNATFDYLENDVYVNPTTTTLRVIYRVQPMINATCFGDPEDIEITVRPRLTAGAIMPPVPSLICYNTAPSTINSLTTAGGGNGVYTYSWYYTENLAAVPGDASWTEISGATGTSYSPGALTADTKFVRKVKDSVCSVEEYSNEITITIIPLPVTSPINGLTALCDNASNIAYSVNDPGFGGTPPTDATTYEWEVFPAGILNITFNMNANVILVSAVSGASGTATIRVREYNTVTGCTGDWVDTNVTVDAAFSPEPITGPTVVCEGTANVRYAVTDRPGSSYNWAVGGASIIGTNTAHEIFLTFNANPFVSSALISVTETSAAGCVTVHGPMTITINPLPIAYNVSAPIAYCDGSPGVDITLSGSQTGVSYQLYKDGVANGAPVAGTGLPLVWTNNTFGIYEVFAVNGFGCERRMNGSVAPTINYIMAGDIGGTQTICQNTYPSIFTNVASASSPSGGVVTYQWLMSTDNGVTFTQILGAILPEYTHPVTMSADAKFKRVAYSTFGTGANAVVCSDTTNTIDVFVNIVNAGVISANQIICYNSIPAMFVSTTDASGNGSRVYRWEQSIDGINYVPVSVGGTFADYTSTTPLTQNTWYRRAVVSTLNGRECTVFSNAVEVTVVYFIPGVINFSQIICPGDVPAQLTGSDATGTGTFSYQWQSSPDGSTWTPVGVTTASYSPPALTVKTYFRRLAISNLNAGCEIPSNVVEITINDFDPGSIGDDQTICEGDIPVAFTETLAPSGEPGTVFTYVWQSSVDGSSWVNISGATSATYAHTTPLTQDTYFRRQVIATLTIGAISHPCSQYTAPVLVTVNNVTAGFISSPQTICEGANAAALTYSGDVVMDGTPSYQWQSRTESGTFADIIGATGTSYTPTGLMEDMWYRLVVTSTLGTVSCPDISNEIRITVINFDPGSIAGDQTICEGTSASPITSVDPSGDGYFTYRWFISTDGGDSGGTWSVTAGTGQTFSPGILTQDTWYYREVVSLLNGVTCTLRTNEVKKTVNNMDPGSIGSNQIICDGDIPAPFTSVAATGDGVITYLWEYSTNGISFTPITGETNPVNQATYTSTIPLVQDTWFRRAATSELNGNFCTEYSNIVEVMVVNFVPGSIGSDQTICEGATAAAFTSVPASGDGTFSYVWEMSIDNGLTWTVISGATSATYSPGVLMQDTKYRRRAVSNLNTACFQYSNEVTVTVVNFDPGSINNTTPIICEGDTPAAFTSVAPSGDGTFAYQWQISTDGSNWSNISLATNPTYQPGALFVDTWYRRQVIATVNSYPCPKYTADFLITVNNVTAGSISMAQTICEGSNAAALTYAGDVIMDGTPSYQWQSRTEFGTFADIIGATGTSYTPTGLMEDMWYRLVVTSTLGTVSCPDISNEVRITVINFIPGSIAADQTICEGSNASSLTSVSPSGDGTFTYRWFISTDGGDSGGTWTLTAGTGETFNPGILTQDTWYYREVVSRLNGVTCTLRTNEVRVTVNNMNPGSIGANQIICDGDIPAPFTSVAATGDGVITYLWEMSTNGIFFTAITGETNPVNQATYTSTISLTQDTWFRRAATSELNGNFCTEYSNIVEVMVVNFVPGSISSDQTICEGATAAAFTSVPASGDGTFSYVWEMSIDNGLTWTVISGATSATYSPGVLIQDTKYRRRAVSNLNTSCFQYSNEVTVTVINFVPGSISTTTPIICEGDTPAAFTSVAPSGDGTFAYQWQISPDGSNWSNIPLATSPTYQPGALFVDTWYRRQVIATVGGYPCSQYTADFLITVNNVDAGTISSAQTICHNTAPALLTSSGVSGDALVLGYQWQSSTDGSTFANISGATGTTYQPAALTVDTWYRLVVTSTLGTVSCPDISNEIRISVIDFNAGTIGTNHTICEGGYANLITSTNDPSSNNSNVYSYSYRWYSSTDAGSTWSPISGIQGAGITYNPGILTTTTWYKREVTALYGGVTCVLETSPVIVTVTNFNPGSISGDQTICEGDIPAAFTVTAPFGNADTYDYQWQSSTDGFFYFDIIGATGANYNPGAVTMTTYYKRFVIATLNGVECTLESNNFITVTVNNVGAGQIGLVEQIICSGDTPSPIMSYVEGTVAAGAVRSYDWVSSIDGGLTWTPMSLDAPTYSPGALTQDTWYRRITRSALGTSVCIDTSNIVRILVNTVAGGSISANQSICYGTAPAPFTSTNNGTWTGTVTYEWWRSDNGTDFYPIAGTNSATYTHTGLLYADAHFKRVIISNRNGMLCRDESNVITVSINPLPIGQIIYSNQTICPSGTAVIEVVITSGTAPFTVNIANHGTVTLGSGTNFVTVSPTATTTTYSITGITDANGCVANTMTGTATVMVRDLPAIVTQPVSITVCENTTATFNVTATGSDIAYQWQVRKTSGGLPENLFSGIGSIYNIINSPTGSQISFTAEDIMDGYEYRVIVSSVCATETSAWATLTVNTAPNITVHPVPLVEICENGSAMFTVQADGTALTYQWLINRDDGLGFVVLSNDANFGGSTTNQLTVTNAPLTFNNYRFRVEVSGTCPPSKISSETRLAVTPQPVVTQHPVNQVVCEVGGPVYFRGFANISTQYQWQVNTGSGWTNITDDAVYSGTVSYELRLNNVPLSFNGNRYRLVFTAACATIMTNEATLTVNPNPVVSLTSLNACRSIPITLNGNFTGGSGGPYTYSWAVSGYSAQDFLNSSTIQNPTFTATISGTFTFTLTVTDVNGCSASGNMTVTVADLNAQFMANPTSQVYSSAGNAVAFTDQTTPSGSWTYLWRFGDGATSTAQNPTHVYNSTGDFNVTMIVSNGTCLDSATHTVRVIPPLPVADFDSIPPGCTPLVISLNNTSLNADVPGTTFRWDFGDGNYSTEKNPTHTYYSAGTFRIELTVTSPDGMTQSVKSQVVHVYASPKAYFEVAPTYVYVNDESVRTFNLSTGASAYMWEFGDGDTSRLREPIHRYMESGVFDITLWAYSENGCTDQFVLSPGVTVDPAGELRFATVFRPNLSGPVELSSLPTGGNEIDQFFFPPIRDRVIDYRLQVFNRLGVLIFESHDINIPWNGYYRGQLCSQGVYVWYVEGKYSNGQPFKQVGDVTLLH